MARAARQLQYTDLWRLQATRYRTQEPGDAGTKDAGTGGGGGQRGQLPLQL